MNIEKLFNRVFKYMIFCCFFCICQTSVAQKIVQCVTTTKVQNWQEYSVRSLPVLTAAVEVIVRTENPLQVIKGFGACFNELGWKALQNLSEQDQAIIFKELFQPGNGCNFTICRAPVGANDFSTDWYSYNETDGDFAMKHFSINHDAKTLIPFIKLAQKYNPVLKLWASPWSPPSWMKYNHHYACNTSWNGVSNGLKPDQVISEGHDAFIQKDNYFKAYALYFKKYITAYKKEGITISMVMPQNEFNSSQLFPSCTWTALGLSKWISYLGPAMKEQNVKVFLGTDERANSLIVDTIMKHLQSGKYITGAGFQWAGKDAIPVVHQKYPSLTLYQTEQECGDGKNTRDFSVYAWQLMKHYFNSGANAYMYWNIALAEGGISHWGWKQNSLIIVDTANKSFKYTNDFYLIKHLSHFVMAGAHLLKTESSFSDLLAFKNPDGSIILLVYNDSKANINMHIKVGNKFLTSSFESDSFTTLVIK